MPERILTLQIRISNFEQAKWIWKCHAYRFHENGVYVDVIQEGKILSELDEKEGR